MKITSETKFDKDQIVFVVWNGVCEGKIRSATLIGGWFGPTVEYSIRGNFSTKKYCEYSDRDFQESDVYATRQEAVAELMKHHKESIDSHILFVKGRIREASRKWNICDCQNDRQRKIMRMLKKWNSELNSMMKEN